MQRRTFMQALSAAFAIPTVGFGFTPAKPTIRWDLWTDEIATRYDLATPWACNESTFATCGRALICAPGCDGELAGERRVPNLDLLPWDDFDNAGWRSSRELVRVPAKGEMVCPHCFGYGVIGKRTMCDCDDIVWDGISDEPSIVCPKCNDNCWLGEKCPHCKNGYICEAPYKLRLDNKHFCAGLFAKFQTLGDFDCLITEQAKQTCMLIRFNGGRGMLMGLAD